MKILMVCMGNICRSPLAEGILKQQIKKFNVDAIVDSVGFEPYHVGDQPDNRAREVALKHGIDISGHRARLFRKDDFDHFDKIYVMDSNNYYDVMSVARNDADKKKVDYIMNTVNPGSNDEVPDPYYGGRSQFNEVYNLLVKACIHITESLKK